MKRGSELIFAFFSLSEHDWVAWFGSVTALAQDGSNGSGFRFGRFLWVKVFSVFLLLNRVAWFRFRFLKTLPTGPVPLSVPGNTFPTVPVPVQFLCHPEMKNCILSTATTKHHRHKMYSQHHQIANRTVIVSAFHLKLLTTCSPTGGGSGNCLDNFFPASAPKINI